MTVELLVKYKNPERKSRLIPIATVQLYKELWQPVAAQLGFKRLGMLGYGVKLNFNDLVEVRDEIIEFERYVMTDKSLIDQTDEMFILQRLRFIVEALTEEIEHWDEVAEIIA